MHVFDLLVERPELFVKFDLVQQICKYLGEDMETESEDVLTMINCADYTMIVRKWQHLKNVIGDDDVAVGTT